MLALNSLSVWHVLFLSCKLAKTFSTSQVKMVNRYEPHAGLLDI